MDKFYPPNFIGYFPLANGKPAAGGYLIACRTGTDVLAPVYNENGTLIPASRVPIDSAGRAHFLLDPSITYRIKVVPPPDVDPINTAVYDNVRVAEGTFVGMNNPMTGRYQMIIGGAQGDPEALEAPTDGGQIIMAINMGHGHIVPQWTGFYAGTGITFSSEADGVHVNADEQEGDHKSIVSAGDTDPDYLINKILNGANIQIAESVDEHGYHTLVISADTQTGDRKTKVSASDSIASYLENKIVGGNAIWIEKESRPDGDGGTEQDLRIHLDARGVPAGYSPIADGAGETSWGLPTGDRKVKLNAADTSPSYLADKLVDGDGIKFTNNGTSLTIAFDNPMDGLGQLIYGGVDGALTKLAIGTDGYVLKSRSGVPTWEAESGGMTNPMTAQYDLIVGGTGGAPTRLATSSSMGNILAITSNSGMIGWTSPSLVIPALANIGKVFAASGDSTPDYLFNKLDAGTGIALTNNGSYVTISATGGGGSTETCQENYSLLNSTNYYDTSSKTNTLFASKVVANATATRNKLGFFHKSGTTGFVLLGVYDNNGDLIASTAKTALTSATVEQMCWVDTLANFTMTAGEEYWFAIIFCEDNWQCNINAIGKVIPVAFDVNLVGARSVGAVNNMPSTLGGITYETQVWYLSAR